MLVKFLIFYLPPSYFSLYVSELKFTFLEVSFLIVQTEVLATEEGTLGGNRYDVVPGDDVVPPPAPITQSVLLETNIAHNGRHEDSLLEVQYFF